jgi:hypothetical protein
MIYDKKTFDKTWEDFGLTQEDIEDLCAQLSGEPIPERPNKNDKKYTEHSLEDVLADIPRVELKMPIIYDEDIVKE